MVKTYVCFHGGCQDGFGAAWAFWRKHGDAATYIPVHWNNPPPEMEDGSDLFILDFGFAPDEMLALKKRMRSITLLDHHKTVFESIGSLAFMKKLDRAEGPAKLHIFFDLTKSGARLAWEHIFPGDTPPMLIQWIEDKDLWKWQFRDSKAAVSGLETYPFKFSVWDEIVQNEAKLLIRGETAVLLKDELIYSICKGIRMAVIDGHTVPVVNATSHWSEVGAELVKRFPDAPFSATYNDTVDCRKWSLRSNGKFDVSKVALKYGGGGHPAAAGFQTKLDAINL